MFKPSKILFKNPEGQPENIEAQNSPDDKDASLREDVKDLSTDDLEARLKETEKLLAEAQQSEKNNALESKIRPVIFDGDPQYNEVPTPEGMIKLINFSKTQLKCGENNELSIRGEVETVYTPVGALEKVTKVYLKGAESPNGATNILKSGWDKGLTEEQKTRAEELANQVYVNKSATDVYERALSEQYKNYGSTKTKIISFFTEDLKAKTDSATAELMSIVGEANFIK